MSACDEERLVLHSGCLRSILFYRLILSFVHCFSIPVGSSRKTLSVLLYPFAA